MITSAYFSSDQNNTSSQGAHSSESKKAQIGVFGLAVMGRNLALNFVSKGVRVSAYNRSPGKLVDFQEQARKEKLSENYILSSSAQEFVLSIEGPRKILLMVQAGAAVDEAIEAIKPYLSKGDVIIDGGNSYFVDTERRVKELGKEGFIFVGMGISGGEEGARNGPSLMPGGNIQAWPLIEALFKKVAARTGKGEVCCAWMGEGGAGHYVKMVHNGIEYGDMQLIIEIYDLLQNALGLSEEKMANVFENWNTRELESFLVDITAKILRFQEKDGTSTLSKILDVAGQKGTGKWMSVNALELGVPLTLITEAVFFRMLSGLKDARVNAQKKLGTFSFSDSLEKKSPKETEEKRIENAFEALLAAKVISYAQGFMLLQKAAQEYRWNLQYSEIALVWRAGCIIRSVFLDKIAAAYQKNPQLENLVLDDYFAQLLGKLENGWRMSLKDSIDARITASAMSSALAFFDHYRRASLPVNLLQAQRDYFGAHTYERVDKPRGEFFHTQWF